MTERRWPKILDEVAELEAKLIDTREEAVKLWYGAVKALQALKGGRDRVPEAIRLLENALSLEPAQNPECGKRL